MASSTERSPLRRETRSRASARAPSQSSARTVFLMRLEPTVSRMSTIHLPSPAFHTDLSTYLIARLRSWHKPPELARELAQNSITTFCA